MKPQYSNQKQSARKNWPYTRTSPKVDKNSSVSLQLAKMFKTPSLQNLWMELDETFWSSLLHHKALEKYIFVMHMRVYLLKMGSIVRTRENSLLSNIGIQQSLNSYAWHFLYNSTFLKGIKVQEKNKMSRHMSLKKDAVC